MVYIDSYNAQLGRMKMCHMIADTEKELYEMVDKIGVKRKWKHNDYYDICLSKKKLAIENGAIELQMKDFIKKVIEIRKRNRNKIER
jgi:hypothetical protein